MPQNNVHIGGQAVIEGVMILHPERYSISVRKPNGSIRTKTTSLRKSNSPLKKLPVIRGFINLVRMLTLGMKALTWSANETATKKEERITAKEMTLTLLVSFGLAIAFFLVLPYALTNWLGYYEESSPFFFNLIDGIIRIAFFILYVWAISFMDDIKRMFQYHGAEHMAIHCFEKKRKLTIANIRKFSTIHPRCGTAFILIVLLISILLFSVIPSLAILIYPSFMSIDFWPRKLILFLLRLSFIPLIAGISYELLKASDKHQDNFLFALLSAPGLWLQKITTQKPTNDQIEVAIASVKAATRTR